MSRRTKPLPSSIPIESSNSVRWRLFAEPFLRYARDVGVFGVRAIDLILRYCFGIREFSQRSDCILRVSIRNCSSEIVLPDAIVIEPGDRILELHFWNEHLIHCLGPHGLFGWGFCRRRRIRFSLMLLSDWVLANDDMADFEGVHASLTISLDRAERVFRNLGFTIHYSKRSLTEQVHDYLENFLICGLMWAFHPYGVRKGKRARRRAELWISRSDFLRIYGRTIHVLP